jgi:predicted short-subunit dehydrogenase-like oxidoreductase (DUF2520 family)
MKITIIGAGNVATHLAKRLFEKGHQINQIINRSLTNAKVLAEKVDAKAINDWADIDMQSAIYLIAVSDDVIGEVAKELSKFVSKNKIVAHTSGATSSTVFKTHFENYGVFYPLQTFSKTRKADFETLPFCIDGSNETTKNELFQLAETICPNVYFIDDKQRNTLHVAAVFANNFTNHLLAISEQIITKENIPFDLLKPLINETVAKINESTPQSMQTGPARRGDKATLAKHQKYLDKYPKYRKIYEPLSESVEDYHKLLDT